MSAEAQRIGHGDTDIRLLPLIDHKVQITGRIRMTIVDRCRHKAVLHCQCRNDRFQCPAGTKQVSDAFEVCVKPAMVKIINVITIDGIVVSIIYRIWENKGVCVTEEANTVVSESGEILSPK